MQGPERRPQAPPGVKFQAPLSDDDVIYARQWIAIHCHGASACGIKASLYAGGSGEAFLLRTGE